MGLQRDTSIWASQVMLVVKNLPANAEEGKRFGFSPLSGKIPWRRKWYLTPTFLPGESHRERSLVDYNPAGHKESDTTEVHWVYSPYYKYAFVAYCVHNSLYFLILYPEIAPKFISVQLLNCV